MIRTGRWHRLYQLPVAAVIAVSMAACSGSPGESGSESVSGSLEDWQAAVCMPGTQIGPSTTPRTITGTTCTPRTGDFYINFDQFESQHDMETMLSSSTYNYSAKTTVGGHPFAIWMPASRDGSELAPLKQFGFTVSRS